MSFFFIGQWFYSESVDNHFVISEAEEESQNQEKEGEKISINVAHDENISTSDHCAPIYSILGVHGAPLLLQF